MPHVKVSSILKDAQKNHYAVAAFNVFNFESMSWIIKGAEKKGMPVIAMLYPGVSSHIPFTTFNAIAKDLAAKASVPIGIHLDHSNSFKEIMASISDGFNSVMIDGSSLSFEENISITRKVVEAAHPMGVDVEAELGLVGSGSTVDDFSNRSNYTDPDDAASFVERTSVDSLAVAIGSAHGNYIKEPKLDLDLLDRIRSKVEVPLVLHGGSGIPESQIKEAVKKGITKVNIGTDLARFFYNKLMEDMDIDKPYKGVLSSLMAIEEDMIEFVGAKIDLLS